jgi:hypothetical protein
VTLERLAVEAKVRIPDPGRSLSDCAGVDVLAAHLLKGGRLATNDDFAAADLNVQVLSSRDRLSEGDALGEPLEPAVPLGVGERDLVAPLAGYVGDIDAGCSGLAGSTVRC